MKADRLLSVLLLLQAHGKQTGRELARRLEVSPRTVHRDMEALSAAGVPVFAVRGARGGWQLDEQWRTQVPGLDEAELRALLMAQPRVLGDGRLSAAAQRAIDKLMAALPASLREHAASIRQRLYVDTSGWFGPTESLAMLPIVQDAVARDRKLAIRYRRADREQVERSVDPLGLVAKGAAWYLVANTTAGYRTYRVSRIEAAELLDEACERPPHFDLAAHWNASTEAFRETRRRFAATLRLEPRAAARVRMWRLTPAGDPGVDSDADGWSTLRVQFEDEQQALFVVLGFGARVEVIDPPSLRADAEAAVVAAADRLRARQGGSAHAVDAILDETLVTAT